MATNSNIEWTEMTWNPVKGCSKVSAGCKHCYAETMAKRLKAMGAYRYRNGFKVTLQPDLLDNYIGARMTRCLHFPLLMIAPINHDLPRHRLSGHCDVIILHTPYLLLPPSPFEFHPKFVQFICMSAQFSCS